MHLLQKQSKFTLFRKTGKLAVMVKGSKCAPDPTSPMTKVSAIKNVLEEKTERSSAILPDVSVKNPY